MIDRSRLVPELREMLDAADELEARSLCELGVESARTRMLQDCQAYWGGVDPIRSVDDRLVPSPAGPVPVRLYRPSDGQLPALVYLHGGGWVSGSIETHDGLCRSLANELPAVVLSVDYRLAPEHPFPAAVDDATAAVRWLFEQAASLGIDRSRISVVGDSAGGNLAGVMARRATRAGLVFASQVLIYPVTDTSTETGSHAAYAEGFLLSRSDMAWFLDQYLPAGAEREHPDCAPLRAHDLAGLPAAHVVTCELDPLRDEGLAYAARLAEAGVEVEVEDWPGMTHGFALMRTVTPAADALRRDIVTFLKSTWSKRAT